MKVRVVPNGVDTNKFRIINRKKAVKWFERNFCELDKDLNIVYVGRFSKEKGVEYLIKSLDYLKVGRLFLIGGGTQEIMLKKMAKKYGDRVYFLGKLDHNSIPFVHNAMDVFVLPSIGMEGFSNSMLEALACGLPVVATPIGAAPDVIKPELGTIVKIKDAKAIAEGVKKVRDLCRKKISNIIKLKYSFKVVADKIYRLYSDIVEYPPKKICFASLFAPPYKLSGIGMQVFELSRALARNCYVVILCGLGAKGILDGVEVVKVKSINGPFLRPVYSFNGALKVLKNNRFDIVDGRNWEGGIISLAAKSTGCKAVMSLRGEGAVGKSSWKGFVNKFIMQRVDCVTATDTKTAKMAEELLV